MVFVGAAAVFAVLNWIAVERKIQNLEYVAKPTTTALLVVAALSLDASDATQRAWFVAALVFCLAGDVFLMIPKDLFVPGLASFLVGHVLFIVGLIAHGVDIGPIEWLYVVVLGLLAQPVIAAVRNDHPDLFVPVVAYIVVIGAMLVTALSQDSLLGQAGGAMFVLSDRILAHNRFIRPFAHGQLATMVTYHAALILLVLSLR